MYKQLEQEHTAWKPEGSKGQCLSASPLNPDSTSLTAETGTVHNEWELQMLMEEEDGEGDDDNDNDGKEDKTSSLAWTMGTFHDRPSTVPFLMTHSCNCMLYSSLSWTCSSFCFSCVKVPFFFFLESILYLVNY